ncbi:MAG: ATP-dependent Clp protease proteolytic subunit [Alistipes sp.]|jgi:ATP-dependent Clp endopeptidase proteolytic subunit ClpP|nr:ATP-dependent Clp protease proteolytic subunit [Alistipes sp.]
MTMTQRFFNMIPGPDSSCCILLYGEIGEWGDANHSADFVRVLMDAAATCKKIDIRINSIGGEVHAGIAIINAITRIPSEVEVTIYIDAIAASIAALIAMCGRRVEISQFGSIMFHSVSAGAYGNRADITSLLKEMEILENTLSDMLSKRTGQTTEQIRETYFDGEDHWLTAQDALALGLVDAIYDAEPVPDNSNRDQIYNIVLNRVNVQPKNTNMLDKLKKRASFANCATDEDVLERIENLETEAAKVTGLESENTRLAAEAEARRVADEAAADAEVDAELEDAVKTNRIAEPERAEFKAIYKASPETYKAQLGRRKPAKRVVDVLAGGGDPGASAWDKRMDEIANNKK